MAPDECTINLNGQTTQQIQVHHSRLQNRGTLIPQICFAIVWNRTSTARQARPLKVAVAGKITYLHFPELFLFRFPSFWDVDIPNLISINKAKQPCRIKAAGFRGSNG